MNKKLSAAVSVCSLVLAALVFLVPAGLARGQDSLANAQKPAAIGPAGVGIQPVSLVELSAQSAQDSYFVGDQVSIQVALANGSGLPLGLSNLANEVLYVTEFTRNGQHVSTFPGSAYYYDGFDSALHGSLTAVPSGGILTFNWLSRRNKTENAEVLKTIEKAKFDNIASQRLLSKPGDYSITFHYQYPSTQGPFRGTIFNGKTNSVTVKFTVV